MSRIDPLDATREIYERRYPEAKGLFLAGSVATGRATDSSDLDIVVVFEKAANAYRESFMHAGWPVEAFVHDEGTLAYFFEEVDAKSGFPALREMVSTGVEITPKSEFSSRVRQRAIALLEQGPPPLDEEALRFRRYMITDLIEDVRTPLTSEEASAAGARLYESLADFYFRARGEWSAKGKQIPRQLSHSDPAMATRFADAFHALFAGAETIPAIRLAEDILGHHGGLLFDGFRRDAPRDWRR